MADISKITLLNGTTYDIKDTQARADIADIQSAISGGLNLLGETTTALSDNATTNPITINSASVTARKGDLALYGKKEFLFNGTKWIEMGDLSLLKALAYKDSASGSFTPAGSVSQSTFTGDQIYLTAEASADLSMMTLEGVPQGTVSQPTFTGDPMASSGRFKPEGTISFSTTNKTAVVSKDTTGTATYTPEGSVAAPTISVKTAGSTTTVNSITAVGTLPSLTTTVANETLTLGFDAGSLPTKGANTTVKTGDAAYQASAPAFTGTGVKLVTSNIAVPSSATFTGTESSVVVSGTPTGTVSRPTFTGSNSQVSGSPPAYNIQVSTYTEQEAEDPSVDPHSYGDWIRPTGTVSKPTFTGTAGTVTVS